MFHTRVSIAPRKVGVFWYRLRTKNAQTTIMIAPLSTKPMGYVSFCEFLWQDWLVGRLETSPFISRTFDLDAAPEPYLSFNSGPKTLALLTTNPGATMPHQLRAAVEAGQGPLKTAIDYAEAARALGAFYEHQLRRVPAGRRIAAMRALSASLGTEGFVQVEACPFHSASLPDKRGLLDEINGGGLLARYVAEVRAFLIDKPTVTISAAPSLDSMGSETPLSPWVKWLSEVEGLDLKRADFIPLVTKKEKVTAMVLVSSQSGVPKALVLMMGSNQLPAELGLGVLAEALRGRFVAGR
jgi:hypothetical protein